MTAPAPYTSEDFAHSPFVAFYEVTRACDLVCAHCRACAQPKRHPQELTHEQSRLLISQFAAFPKPPVMVFTGGDPMKREDIFDLVRHSVDSGLSTAMTPSATPLMTEEAIRGLRDAGLSRLALSIDSANAEVHDDFRGVKTFDRTIEILRYAHSIGLPIQVNTTITKRNVDQVDEMADLFAGLGIALWSVFFLVPVGRGLAEQRIEPWQYEMVFEKLWNHAMRQPYAIKTTEAHHYRRFVLEKMGDPQHQPGNLPRGRIQRAPIGVNDGKGVFFVSHTGTVYPSGFMPMRCGKFPEESVVDIYQKSPVLLQLRDGDLLKGKCGACDYRSICGGSRARAYQLTQDPLASEPDCVYIPRAWKEETVPC